MKMYRGILWLVWLAAAATLALVLFSSVWGQSTGPKCFPLEAGGVGTKSVSSRVHDGRATWWWCPGQDFRGIRTWDLEWFGWEDSWDQFFGMQGFHAGDEEVVRQAWRATRSSRSCARSGVPRGRATCFPHR